MTPIRVSLVIPVRNEEASLGMLLRSIQRQCRLPDEVVIVDGGSTDATRDIVRQWSAADTRFRLIETDEATPGRGRNIGIEAAAHEWIALTDAGMQLHPQWLASLAATAECSDDVDIVYGNYEPITNTWFQKCAALVYVPPRQPQAGGSCRNPCIPSSLLRREAWRRAGGFPDLRAAEDLIFMERLSQQGARISWAPGATVYWQIQPTLGGTFRRFLLYSRHNVWAGRQRFWHYGVARQYGVIVACIALALATTPWWLLALPAWLAARVAKALWLRREGRGLLWLTNPFRVLTCAGILLTIDLATFVGWLQAAVRAAPPTIPKPHASHQNLG